MEAMNRGNEPLKDKKAYTRPDLVEWGAVADLTRTGLTRPGDDAKSGSVLSRGR
jgi:hypothetical protein